MQKISALIPVRADWEALERKGDKPPALQGVSSDMSQVFSWCISMERKEVGRLRKDGIGSVVLHHDASLPHSFPPLPNFAPSDPVLLPPQFHSFSILATALSALVCAGRSTDGWTVSNNRLQPLKAKFLKCALPVTVLHMRAELRFGMQMF